MSYGPVMGWKRELYYTLIFNPGPGSGSPTKFLEIGNYMYFTADNGSTGSELFSLDHTTVNLPLPVELLDFSAKALSDGTVSLQWITGEELNHDYFEVERSLDGRLFTPIIRTDGKGDGQSYHAP